MQAGITAKRVKRPASHFTERLGQLANGSCFHLLLRKVQNVGTKGTGLPGLWGKPGPAGGALGQLTETTLQGGGSWRDWPREAGGSEEDPRMLSRAPKSLPTPPQTHWSGPCSALGARDTRRAN